MVTENTPTVRSSTDYYNSTDEFDKVFFYSMMHSEKGNKMKYSELFWEQLHEISLPVHQEKDYFNAISLDTLQQIFELDGLTMEMQMALEEDIANLQSNYPMPQFQEKTNELISTLVGLLKG